MSETVAQPNNHMPEQTRRAALLYVLAASIPLAVIDVVYGVYHRNDNTCDSFLNVSDWLIIKGASTLGSIISFLFLLNFFATRQLLTLGVTCQSSLLTVGSVFSMVLYFASLLFEYAWLVTGSVIFWNDCRHLSPETMKNFLWATLIIGYVSTIFRTKTLKAAKL